VARPAGHFQVRPSPAIGRQRWSPRPEAGPGRCVPSAPTARCSGPAWPPTGTRTCRPARRDWPGRRARTCTRWTAARRGRPGPGPGSGAQEIASTLTGRRSSGALLRSGVPSRPSQFQSHSPLSGTVHHRPPWEHHGWSRTAADPRERWPALLESVLGATPQEFESPILRRADLPERRSRRSSRWRRRAAPCLIFCLSLSPGYMPYYWTNQCDGTLRWLTSYLVRDVAGVPERNRARRPSVRAGCRSGRPGPSVTWVHAAVTRPENARLADMRGWQVAASYRLGAPELVDLRDGILVMRPGGGGPRR
jgi:hypothetical protein